MSRIFLRPPIGCRFIQQQDGSIALDFPYHRIGEIGGWLETQQVQIERDLAHADRLEQMQAQRPPAPTGPVTTRQRGGSVTVTPLSPRQANALQASQGVTVPAPDYIPALCAECGHTDGYHAEAGEHPCEFSTSTITCACKAFAEPIDDESNEVTAIQTRPPVMVAPIRAVTSFPGIPAPGRPVIPAGRSAHGPPHNPKEGPPPSADGIARPGAQLPPGFVWHNGMIVRAEPQPREVRKNTPPVVAPPSQQALPQNPLNGIPPSAPPDGTPPAA